MSYILHPVELRVKVQYICDRCQCATSAKPPTAALDVRAYNSLGYDNLRRLYVPNRNMPEGWAAYGHVHHCPTCLANEEPA